MQKYWTTQRAKFIVHFFFSFYACMYVSFESACCKNFFVWKYRRLKEDTYFEQKVFMHFSSFLNLVYIFSKTIWPNTFFRNITSNQPNWQLGSPSSIFLLSAFYEVGNIAGEIKLVRKFYTGSETSRDCAGL